MDFMYLMAWGEVRYASGTTPTDFTYTGQRSEMDGLGLMYYGARWYDPSFSNFTQPDTVIPDPHNPQDWNRFAYARYNPVRYNDPTGHWPDWLDDVLDYAQGAAYQFTNDMTGGAVDNIADSYNVCMDCNASDAYKQGQQACRAASTAVSSTEVILGGIAVVEGLAAMGPTAGGGFLCGAVTAGGCLVIAGVGLTVEGAMVVGGTVAAGNGLATMAYMKNNPVGKTPLTPSEIRRSIASLEMNITEH